MKMIKVSLCLLGLFVCGVASGIGVSGSRFLAKGGVFGHGDLRWLERRYDEDCRRLSLTPQQQDSLRSQYDDIAAEMGEIREETIRRVRELFVQKGTEFWQVLTPGQREEFQNLNEERRARWKANAQ
jgi:Spy/CpxP family protein refolding chaperone